MIPNSSLIVSSTEPTGNNRRKVWMQKGKNLLDLSNISSETLNGVTITRNEDGSITLNGTATRGFSIKQPVNLSLESGTYTHSITNKVIDIFFSLDNKDETMIGKVDALETYKTFTLNEKTTYSEYLIWINSGATFSNYTFYPIICQGAYTTYEKYIEPKIYVKNDNDVYEEFININQQIKVATYTKALTSVSTTTNIDFSTMFPNLSLSQVICFNIEITNVDVTWDRVFAHILTSGQLQVRSYAQTQELTVKVTAFYK